MGRVLREFFEGMLAAARGRAMREGAEAAGIGPDEVGMIFGLVVLAAIALAVIFALVKFVKWAWGA